MPGEVDCNSIADLNSGDGKCRPDHYDPILKRDIYGSRVSAKQRLLCRRAVSPQTDKLPVFAIGKKTARGKQTIHHKYKRWDRKLNTGSKKSTNQTEYCAYKNGQQPKDQHTPKRLWQSEKLLSKRRKDHTRTSLLQRRRYSNIFTT